MTDKPPLLQVIDIHKSYEGQPLLNGISFNLEENDIVCLLGPSGSGKSTLLRIIAGLESAESGRILWNGMDQQNIPTHQRNFGFMFQDYALFPHRTVEQNIAFGMRMKNASQDEIERRVEELLRKVNLGAFAKRKVTDLSGGEQQRVAMARTLAPRPRLLLLDEPMGALDHSLSEQLLVELRQVLRESGTPTIYVTHDQQEAFSIAERIMIIHEGEIVQEGPPQQVYRQPASKWAAEFLGLTNLLDGKVISHNPLQVETCCGIFLVQCGGTPPPAGAEVTLLIRSAEVSTEPGPDLPNHLHGRVRDAIFQGTSYQVDVDLPVGRHLRFHLPTNYIPAEEIDLYFSPTAAACIA
ncbi:MAG: ABC transporter ATP-binding protein [Anaerolineaceae bacterium]